MPARLLGPADEPRRSGSIVVVHYGDYRHQCAFVNSGANIGCWYPLGNEFGRPRVAEDPRSNAERVLSREYWQRPPGTIPQHPHWEDVLALGPVTLLVAADGDSYRQGWRAGRRDLWQAMEEIAEEDPREVNT